MKESLTIKSSKTITEHFWKNPRYMVLLVIYIIVSIILFVTVLPQVPGILYTLIGIVFTVGIAVLAAIQMDMTQTAMDTTMKQFAISIGYTYIRDGDPSTVDGSTLDTGYPAEMTHVISGTDESYPIRIFYYSCRRGTNSGVNMDTVVEITFRFMMPHILVNGTESYFSDAKELKIGEEFDQHFPVYVEKGFEVEARKLFTPNIVKKILSDFPTLESFELFENRLFVKHSYFIENIHELEELLATSKRLCQLLSLELKKMEGYVHLSK